LLSGKFDRGTLFSGESDESFCLMDATSKPISPPAVFSQASADDCGCAATILNGAMDVMRAATPQARAIAKGPRRPRHCWLSSTALTRVARSERLAKARRGDLLAAVSWRARATSCSA